MNINEVMLTDLVTFQKALVFKVGATHLYCLWGRQGAVTSLEEKKTL